MSVVPLIVIVIREPDALRHQVSPILTVVTTFHPEPHGNVYHVWKSRFNRSEHRPSLAL